MFNTYLIQVVSLTCDGPSCHFAMLRALGANIDPQNLKPYFENPAKKDEKIFVIFDVCHMLKLVRNTLATGDMMDSDGNSFSYTEFR